MKLHMFATTSCSLPAHQAWRHSAEMLGGTELAWQPLKQPPGTHWTSAATRMSYTCCISAHNLQKSQSKERQTAHLQLLHQGLLPQHLPAGSTPCTTP